MGPLTKLGQCSDKMDKICLGTINERGENFAMFAIFITIYNYIYNQEYELSHGNMQY